MSAPCSQDPPHTLHASNARSALLSASSSLQSNQELKSEWRQHCYKYDEVYPCLAHNSSARIVLLSALSALHDIRCRSTGCLCSLGSCCSAGAPSPRCSVDSERRRDRSCNQSFYNQFSCMTHFSRCSLNFVLLVNRLRVAAECAVCGRPFCNFFYDNFPRLHSPHMPQSACTDYRCVPLLTQSPL